jgi:hypothetical protein
MNPGCPGSGGPVGFTRILPAAYQFLTQACSIEPKVYTNRVNEAGYQGSPDRECHLQYTPYMAYHGSLYAICMFLQKRE